MVVPDPDVMMIGNSDLSDDNKEDKKPDEKGGPGTGPSSGPTTGGKSTNIKKEDCSY